MAKKKNNGGSTFTGALIASIALASTLIGIDSYATKTQRTDSSETPRTQIERIEQKEWLSRPLSESPETYCPERVPSWEELNQQMEELSSNIAKRTSDYRRSSIQDNNLATRVQEQIEPRKPVEKSRSYKENSIKMPSVKNNNPGNIKYFGKRWAGQVGVKNGFVVFKSTQYGLRALSKNLRCYQTYGVNSIEEVITRWAPMEDNNPTENYINYVCKKTGYTRSQTIDLRDREVLANLTSAIASFDSGKSFTREHAYKGLELLEELKNN